MSAADNKAVFLSYASQDAGAARRICESLRSGGVEVWFDADGGLEHGDEWDAKIRRQIKECVLFIPVISANTQARHEGYFRIEWDLAAERARGIASGVPFILPVVIDDTREPDALVPDRFRSVQWTRLCGGEVSPEVRARFLKLWSHRTGVLKHQAAAEGAISTSGSDVERGSNRSARNSAGWKPALLFVGTVVIIGASWWLLRRSPPGTTPPRPASAGVPPTSAAPQTEAQKLVAQMWGIYDRIDDVSSEEWALAEDLGAQATKLEPLNAEAWAAYADVTLTPYILGYERSVARRERALKFAERATSLAPDGTEPRLALANCYRVGDVENASADLATRTEAERIVRELVVREPANRHVLRMAGNVMRAQRKFDESITFFDRANALPGGDAIALLSKEFTLKITGRFAEAEATLNQSFALHAGPAAYVRRLFYLLYVYDDLDGAAEIVAKVPGPFLPRDEATQFVSSLWLWRHDAEKCIATLRRFDGDELYGVPKGYLIGHAFEASGRMPAAEVEWQAALQKLEAKLATAPNDAHALYWKAYLLACLGEKTEANRLLRIYEQMTSPGGNTLDFLQADILARLERNDEALATIEIGARDAVRSPNDLEWRGSLRHDPVFDPLRRNPRFQALLAKLNASKLHAVPMAPSAGTAAAPATVDATPAVKDKSVAVLAFANLSDDKGNEYFSDGISEELISVLGRVPGLTVKGSTSAFYFKHREDQFTSAEIARQLGVTYLVRGSVRKAGDQVRITAQLTRAASDEVVWSSEPLTREVKDVFAVQEEVARLIAQKLQLKLNGAAATRTAVNPVAYELYLQARQAWNLRNADGYDRAEKMLAQSIALAPDFAPAHAALVDVWTVRGEYDRSLVRWGSRDTSAVARIAAKSRQAIALDPASPEAHASLGFFSWEVWRFADAERELREAIRLNSNYASAHQWLGRTLMSQGRLDEALAELKTAAELDPLSPRILDNYALALLHAERPAEALEFAERALRQQPNAGQALAIKVIALAELGRTEAAVASAGNLSPLYSLHAAIAFGLAGARDEAARLLASLRDNDMIERVAAMAGMGRTEEALAALQPPWMIPGFTDLLLFNRLFDPLRGDSRFKAFLATLGMTEAHDRAQAWRAAHPPEKSQANTK